LLDSPLDKITNTLLLLLLWGKYILPPDVSTY
jgi:hypothetical protein